MAVARPKEKPKAALIPRILPSHYVPRLSSDALAPRAGRLAVSHQRPYAAREAEDARPAFALDLLGAETKRGDAAIDRKTIARRRPVERGSDAKNLAPPFAERDRKSALLAQLHVGQGSRLHIVGFF